MAYCSLRVVVCAILFTRGVKSFGNWASAATLCSTMKLWSITSTPAEQVLADPRSSGYRWRKMTGNALQGAAAMLTLATVGRTEAARADQVLTRADVGFINLNDTMPEVTDVCWLDIAVGDSAVQRVEISLFGKVTPQTAENFKQLCKGTPGYGYAGSSDIFRVVSTFSIQGGNISPPDTPQSQLAKEGQSANGDPFPPENYRILHSFKDAGVVSMMKDIKNNNFQDSRFFITTSPYASWADDRYVAFGLVTKGQSFVKGFSILPTTPPTNFPNTRVRIISAGVY